MIIDSWYVWVNEFREFFLIRIVNHQTFPVWRIGNTIIQNLNILRPPNSNVLDSTN